MDDILYGKEGVLPGKFKKHLIFDKQFEFLKRFVSHADAKKLIVKKAKFCHKIQTDPQVQATLSSEKISTYRLYLRGLRPTYYNLKYMFVISLQRNELKKFGILLSKNVNQRAEQNQSITSDLLPG